MKASILQSRIQTVVASFPMVINMLKLASLLLKEPVCIMGFSGLLIRSLYVTETEHVESNFWG